MQHMKRKNDEENPVLDQIVPLVSGFKGKWAFDIEAQKQGEDWRSNRNGDHRDRWRAHLCDEGFLSSIWGGDGQRDGC